MCQMQSVGWPLSEKILAQGIGRPVLIPLSRVINQKRKQYYQALENANKDCDLTDWLLYFGEMVLEAVAQAERFALFFIYKIRLFERLKGQLNPRQTKVLLRIFRDGPDSFVGGLTAAKYIRISQATRPTATRDLTDLVDKGVFYRVGERKGTRYLLTVDLPDMETPSSIPPDPL